jgi:phospholipid/cholesterol/gamma-HCH transport system ATP-binding protein
VGVEITVENLTKRFGSTTIWEDVSLTLPAGEISVMLGPSGTGKSVFLKTLIGLLKPENGSIIIDGTDITKVREKELYEVRKLFGVLFQDGALFGSQNLYDNIAFPLREHTKKSEREIKDIVMEKLELTGLNGAEEAPGRDLRRHAQARRPGPRAGAGPRDPAVRRAGLRPRPVRTAYLNQLIVDLNARSRRRSSSSPTTSAPPAPSRTTSACSTAATWRCSARARCCSAATSRSSGQFLNAQRQGPIGMAEEKDAGELAAEAEGGQELPPIPPIPFQLVTSDGEMRETQRAPGAWLRDHGVVPPPGSFAGTDVEVPVGDGSATGWNGTTPPARAAEGSVRTQRASEAAGGGGGPVAAAPPTSGTPAPPATAEPASDAPASSPRSGASRAPLRSRVPAGGARDGDAATSVLVVDPPADEVVEAPPRPRRSRRPRGDG